MRLDLLALWKEQSAPEELIKNIDFVAPIVGDTVIELVSKGYIPKELAKGRKVNGKTLWTILLGKNLELPAPFKSSNTKPSGPNPGPGVGNPMTGAQEKSVNQVMKCGSDKLWALTSWAKETDNLQPWQRGIIASVAKLVGSGKEPSGKQAVQTMKALTDAEELGFRYTEE